MRVRSILAACLMIGATTGCYKNTLQTGMPGAGSSDHKAKFFLWGLVGDNQFDLKQLCPSGVSEIIEQQAAGDVIVGCLTCGIYQPVTVSIRCASGSAFNLIPDEENNRTWVYPDASASVDLPEHPGAE